MSAEPVDEPVFVRYQADIWAEVAADGEVVAVIVDSATMAQPVEVVLSDRTAVTDAGRTAAVEAAQSGLWPSWDYGPSPVGASPRSGGTAVG